MYLLTILHLATRIADYRTKTKHREKKISFKQDQDLAAFKRPEISKEEEEERVRKRRKYLAKNKKPWQIKKEPKDTRRIRQK